MTSGTTGSAPAGTVEDYLDQLLVSLSGSPREIRYTLAEVEAHLRDAVAEGVAAGLPEPQAEAAAVDRIGPVQGVNGRLGLLGPPWLALARRVVLTGALVGGTGLLFLGGAGLIARIMAAVNGARFITAPWPAGTYTAADCARWLAGDPGSHSCTAAMLADHAYDFVLQAAAAALLGMIALGCYAVLRRRWRDRATLAALPAGTAEVLGAILALLCTMVFFGQVVDLELVQYGVGLGAPLSLGLAALAATAFFAVRCWRVLRPAV